MTKNKEKLNLPETLQLEVSEIGNDGEVLARPTEARFAAAGSFYVLPNSRIRPPLVPGDRFLARISGKKGVYTAKPMVRTAFAQPQAEKQYGVVEKRGGRYFIVSAEKSKHTDMLLDNPGKVRDGDFVSYVSEGARRFKEVRIVRNFGPFNLGKAASMLVLEKYGIPETFDAKVGKELERLPKLDLQGRENLANLPFVTIDGEDSKDFDDAVWAERTPLGFRLGVAIADVAFYVRPGSELDREAYRRGNSVYLPNLTIPMLPEKLSNDLCSLRPKEKRPVIACFMEIDGAGRLRQYDFCRGVIKSAARLTYREVQEALDGRKSENIAPVFKSAVLPLYEAYLVLDRARKKRGALELETTELKIRFDKAGQATAIEKAPHYVSEKIIEEFMIAANVAAAQALAKCRLPVMYRIHDRPQPEKMKDMIPFLEELKMKLPDAPALKPAHFNRIMEKCREKNLSSGIDDLVLRMQSQAQYSPDNIGHFGLGLKDYAHFTSPIRRYADLLIHRALIRCKNFPGGGALENGATHEQFVETGEHLGVTERRAASAEREMTARYISAYLKPSVGQVYKVCVSGLTTAGIFVRIEDLGAEGLIPMNSLPNDKYTLSENRCLLSASKLGLEFSFGEKIRAMLTEATPVSGGLIFKYIDDDSGLNYADKGSGRLPKTKKSVKKNNKAEKRRKRGKKCAES